jgi:formylglycine-generating enzyme required for sulfatase activity
MRKVLAVAAALALLCLGGIAQADVFNLGPGLTNLETVPVGDPGNTGELSGAGGGGYGPDKICGSVGYAYNIGKYEVTAAQYTDFLNHKAKTDTYGLYMSYMGVPDPYYGCNIQRSGSSGSYTYTVGNGTTDVPLWGNRPVNYVSFWDACRFANWLGNGQGNGDTENGAYTLNGYNGQDGRTIQRNAGGTWAVTSEDEWYKAAYYKGGGTNAGYWDYPTQSDAAPSNVGSDGYTDPGNHANYYNNGYTIGSPYWRTNAGEFENSASAYGTFDQGGNVWEWNEAIVYQGSDYALRGLRGGSFYRIVGSDLLASSRNNSDPTFEYCSVGFRVSGVPEPSSIIALVGGLISLLGIRRRRA